MGDVTWHFCGWSTNNVLIYMQRIMTDSSEVKKKNCSMYALLRKDTGTVSMWKSDWNTGKPIPCPIQDASCSVFQSFSYSLTPSFHVKFSSVKFGSCYKTAILFRFRNVWGLALSVQCEDSQELHDRTKALVWHSHLLAIHLLQIKEHS